MTEKPQFKTHFACLAALFVLGSGVITLPTQNADRYSLYALLISVLFSFAVFYGFFVLWNYCFKNNQNTIIFKVLSALVYLSVAVYSLFSFSHTFKLFTRFAAHILLRDTSYLTAAILLGLVVWFFASRKQEDILKFSLVSLFAALPVIIFFFLAATNDYKIENIFIFDFPEFKNLFKNLLPFLKEISFPLIILFPYCTAFNKNSTKSTAKGIAMGYLLLSLCISSAIMLFGPSFSARIEYPYTAAVSTVSVGRLFTRMDYFSYFIYFTSAIVKITVCIASVRECLRQIDRLCKPGQQ